MGLNSVQEEADERGVSATTVRRWIGIGAPAVLVAGKTYLNSGDIDAWLDQDEDETPDEDEDELDEEDEEEEDELNDGSELGCLRAQVAELAVKLEELADEAGAEDDDDEEDDDEGGDED